MDSTVPNSIKINTVITISSLPNNPPVPSFISFFVSPSCPTDIPASIAFCTIKAVPPVVALPTPDVASDAALAAPLAAPDVPLVEVDGN